VLQTLYLVLGTIASVVIIVGAIKWNWLKAHILDRLVAYVDTRRHRVERLQKQVDTLQADNAQLRDTVDSLSERVEGVESSVDWLLPQVSGVRVGVLPARRLEERVADLEHATADVLAGFTLNRSPAAQRVREAAKDHAAAP
jgi:hypothetical protein